MQQDEKNERRPFEPSERSLFRPWYFSDHPAAGFMEITPEIARELLATSPGNRAIRKKRVSDLARSITAGQWVATGSGIAVNCKGELRDGHHRLSAICEAGIAVKMLVSLGVPEEAYFVTDIGLKRTLGDLMPLDRRNIEVCRLALLWCFGWNTPSPQEIDHLNDSDFGAAHDALLDNARQNKKIFSSASMRLAAIIAVLSGEKAGFVKGQYEALIKSEFPNMTPATLAFWRACDKKRITASASGVKVSDFYCRATKVFSEKLSANTKMYAADKEDSEAQILKVVTPLMRNFMKEEK